MLHMNEPTQLLCTFTTVDELSYTATEIKKSYELSFNKLYVLENVNDANQLVLTYNILKIFNKTSPISTIAVHRKKQTNTIYTINAINKLIEANNNGILDKSYRINWDTLKNTVLVTAYGNLKIVNTKLLSIINF
jgi:hypothetical protein